MTARAFIIVGPSSSGSRFVSRLFVQAGALGETGFVQSFDTQLPEPEADIVWKSHNNHLPGAGTIPVAQQIKLAQEAGYEPVVVLVFRDVFALTASMTQRQYDFDNEDPYGLNTHWYLRTWSEVLQLDVKTAILSYDALSVYNDAYIRFIEKLLDFKFADRNYAVDENKKYFYEKAEMKTSDGYTLEIANRSGIPFFVRQGTVDVNVLDEVIVGDPYKLNQIVLRENPNIVDVGGHIGAFTKLSAWKWPHAKHYVYEANPRNWEVLELNLQEIRHKVVLYKGALVGSEPTNKRLVINALEANRVTGGWGIIFSDQAYEPGAGEATEEIENFYHIKDLWPALDKVDILKLDCEGSEFSILKHMSEEELHKVDYLVCEIHCGALPHHDWTYEEFRAKILRQFICPELDARPHCGPHDLFNIVACNKKLLPK